MGKMGENGESIKSMPVAFDVNLIPIVTIECTNNSNDNYPCQPQFDGYLEARSKSRVTNAFSKFIMDPRL